MHLNNRLLPLLDAALAEKIVYSKSCFSIELCFPDSFFYFNGHFPEHPIVPAAIAFELSIALACQFGKSLHFMQAKRCKFTRNIYANERVRIKIQNKAGVFTIEWVVIGGDNEETKAISLNLEFADPTGDLTTGLV